MVLFIVIARLAILFLVLGVIAFMYYLRTRNRWAWTVAVALLTVGGLGLSFWF